MKSNRSNEEALVAKGSYLAFVQRHSAARLIRGLDLDHLFFDLSSHSLDLPPPMDRPKWFSNRTSYAPTRREIAIVCFLSAVFLITTQLNLAGSSWSAVKSGTSPPGNKIHISDGNSIVAGHNKEDGLYDYDFYEDTGLPDGPAKGENQPHREFSSHVKPHGSLSHSVGDNVVDNAEMTWENAQVPETSILAHAPGMPGKSRLFMANEH